MRRLDRGPSRRERRLARKGEPSGRRATHPVLTSYGRRQKERDLQQVFSAMCRVLREGHDE